MTQPRNRRPDTPLPRTVGLDSMTIAWSLRKLPGETSELDEKRLRARILMRKLAAEKARIILPAIALSELLIPLPVGDRPAFIAKVNAQCRIAAFDVRAATIAANLWAVHQQLPADQRYDIRRVLKADLMIIAAAKASGAEAFYTDDEKCRRLASEVMKAYGLPKSSGDMLIDHEIRSEGA